MHNAKCRDTACRVPIFVKAELGEEKCFDRRTKKTLLLIFSRGVLSLCIMNYALCIAYYVVKKLCDITF